MAILKHIASKSSNYGAALEYLIFKHDELRKTPILDQNGNRIMRDEFYLDGLNCEPYSFDAACQQLNREYQKNKNKDEIKSHHYIISFNPRDSTENCLMGKRAQELGLEYAKANFPGHQALVCTHMDGHNGSGNIHVHILINSLRKLDVLPQPFMERPIDCKAGYKHHLTKDYLKYLQKSLMDICMRENLNQVDLLSPSLEKMSEQEYHAKRRGQVNLDFANFELTLEGLTPMRTTFETEKEKIRNAITDVAKRSVSFMDFQNLLKLEYGILLKDHRGRFSYLPADRDKFISAKTLGTCFDRAHLLLLFKCNAAEKEKQRWCVDDPMDALYIKSNLRLVVNLQDCVKAQQSYAYAQKVKISNLQKMAQTVLYVQEHGYDSYEELYKTAESIDRKMAAARSDARFTEVKLKKVNEQIYHLGRYFSTKSVYSKFLKAPNKKIFRQTHFDEIAKHEEARQFLKRDFPDEKFPSMKDLRAEKELLMRTKDARYETYHYFKDRNAEIQTVLANVDSILETAKVQRRERQPKRKKRSYDMSL